MESLGGQLARARKAAGLTQKEVAKRAGVDPTTVGRLERGGNVRLETLQRVAEAVSHAVVLIPMSPSPGGLSRKERVGPTSAPRTWEEAGGVERRLVELAVKDGGWIHDPVPHLARRVPCKEWKVWRALRNLQAWGWLRREQRRTGRGWGSLYRLLWDGLPSDFKGAVRESEDTRE